MVLAFSSLSFRSFSFFLASRFFDATARFAMSRPTPSKRARPGTFDASDESTTRASRKDAFIRSRTMRVAFHAWVKAYSSHSSEATRISDHWRGVERLCRFGGLGGRAVEDTVVSVSVAMSETDSSSALSSAFFGLTPRWSDRFVGTKPFGGKGISSHGGGGLMLVSALARSALTDWA